MSQTKDKYYEFSDTKCQMRMEWQDDNEEYKMDF